MDYGVVVDPHSGHGILPYELWTTQPEDVARRFREAEAYARIVIDDFLGPEAADRCPREFPAIDSSEWIHYTHVNEQGYER